MGTRAQFFIGDPRDVDARVWLGCIAWDGQPDSDPKGLALADSPEMFAEMVKQDFAWRDDFADPTKGGFPFPWDNDLFLTDATYAFFGGEVQFTWFHRGFISLKRYLAMTTEERDAWDDQPPTLKIDVPAPAKYDRSAPDSIIVVEVSPGRRELSAAGLIEDDNDG